MPTIQPLENPSAYPRIYRASGGWLIALTLSGLGLALGGGFGAWFIAAESLRNSQSRFWLIGLCLAFGILGVYCLLSAFRSRVVLFADRIEVEELTRTAVLNREDIRGWRSLPTSPPGFVFFIQGADHPPLKVAQLFRLDPEFAQWVYSLPCLDNDDARTSKAEIRKNTRLGATPSERMKTLAKGNRLAMILTAISSVVAFWGFVYPRPYELVVVILAALPWVAVEIVRRSGGLFRIDVNRNDAHPNVALAFIFPGTILALRSVSDYNIVHSPPVLWFTISFGGILCLSALAVDPSVRATQGIVVALLIFSLAYGLRGCYGSERTTRSLARRGLHRSCGR